MALAPTTIEQLNDKQKLIVEQNAVKYLSTAIYIAGAPKTPQQDTPISISAMLGAPVFSNLEIQSGSYTDNNGNTINYPSISLDTVLFDVEIPKIIVRTPINGRNGSVKEYIADDDAYLQISGLLTGDSGIFPVNDWLDLIKSANAPVALAVNSWYLNDLGIFNIVVDNRRFTQREGMQSTQLFSLSCLSDVPYEIQVSQ